ncbi:BCAS3 microtubule associated cell migration factor-like isoform X1 [Branchiostoma floridae x Branchiostoma japonicum]
MSADSPRRGSRSAGTVVRPQAAGDKSYMESVVDFLQAVPQAYSGSKTEDREKIVWARFESTDVNDISYNSEYAEHRCSEAPILLIIGYSNGVQIWNLPSSGEAQEVLSIRQGPVRVLRVLPTPISGNHQSDSFADKRPLVAMCDGSSSTQPYCTVNLTSLKTGEQAHSIGFKSQVYDIHFNKRIVVIALQEKVAAFDASTFQHRFWITSCFPCPGPHMNPLALGTRWLAYADKKLVPTHQSRGGMTGNGIQSYAATVISAAKTITKGLSMFGETVGRLTGNKAQAPSEVKSTSPSKTTLNRTGLVPGIVTIVDTLVVAEGEQVNVQDDNDGSAFVAHFPAHNGEPIAAMEFDPSGQLLVTADILGHTFHVFRILPHPWSSSQGAVHHLYCLHRGDTTAKVQNISYTLDSRWVAVSTLRGTTHVFPVTTYGGPVSVRTHTSARVVNRASRFHKSAGLDEIEQTQTGRHSPVPGSSGSPQAPPSYPSSSIINNNLENCRLPPFPHPTVVTPAAQIKQPLVLSGISSSSTAGKSPTHGSPIKQDNVLCVAAQFASSRGWRMGNPTASREKADPGKPLPVDSLYIISCHGNLMEHVLDPQPVDSIPKMDDAPIQLLTQPLAQWNLKRCSTSAELKPPLPSNSPLIIAADIVAADNAASMSNSMVTRYDSYDSLSSDQSSQEDDHWLSQVEMVTHAGPHRRLWMGPQFSFKTFQTNTAVLSSNSSALLGQSPDANTVDVLAEELDLQSLRVQPVRSQPVPTPQSGRTSHTAPGFEPLGHSPGSNAASMPLLIDSGPGSFDRGTRVVEICGSWPESGPMRGAEVLEDRLRESIADAMIESPTKERPSIHRTGSNSGRREVLQQEDQLSSSSGSGGSAPRTPATFDARSSPPHSIDHVMVFPPSTGSPD